MMASQDVFVGIDVSKDRLDVHLRPLGVGFSVGNEAAGYAGLIAHFAETFAPRIGKPDAVADRLGAEDVVAAKDGRGEVSST